MPALRIEQHRLVGVPSIESPNQNERPDADDISLVVIHAISLPPGQFGTQGITQLFTNRLDPDEHPFYREIEALRVSAHLVIERTGAITQYVDFNRRAWHAGISSWEGRDVCNDFSIGIELEGTEDRPFEARQYEMLEAVLGALFETYPRLSLERVVGHQDIAPERKWDPGPCFDWARIGLERPGLPMKNPA
jgi:N-acetyl-anhydromuramoyl-L-alanine amidase